MFLPWIGRRDLALILATFPDVSAPPADWVNQARARVFTDFADYIRTASYGQATLGGSLFGPFPIQARSSYRGDFGPAVQDAVAAAGAAVANFLFACVMLSETGGRGWAFFGNPPIPPPQNTCWVDRDAPLGVVAMENVHAMTWFGDLYGQPYSPGNWDNMDCSCGTHPSSFTKSKIGWLSPAIVQVQRTWWPPWGRTPVRLTLNDLARPPQAGRVQALRLDPPGLPSTQYYMVEARFRSDRFEQRTNVSSGIPGEGVVVYFIDEDPMRWPPVHLLTPNALQVGGSFSEQRLGTAIRVIAADATSRTVEIGSGVNLAPPPPRPRECDDLGAQEAELRAEIADVQSQLPTAAPQDKANLMRELRQLRAQLAALQQRSTALGCGRV